MKRAIYAGSFDPWTWGHQFVFNSASQMFDHLVVIVAYSLAKRSVLSPITRSRLIAHAIDPLTSTWDMDLPFETERYSIVIYDDLIASYAQQHGIKYLIRGLRSTSDFEYEFQLYFSNKAINHQLETWAVLSPPDKLHCSSTFVKTVVGRQAPEVTCSITAQSCLLGLSEYMGVFLDHLDFTKRFERPFLQSIFLNLYQNHFFRDEQSHKKLKELCHEHIFSRKEKIKKALDRADPMKKELNALIEDFLNLMKVSHGETTKQEWLTQFKGFYD